MAEFKIFHLYWKKYSWSEAALKNFNDFSTDRDFGIYQIYGDHPVYGDDTLLYIGKAATETFARRMKGHYDLDASQVGEQFTRIHLGYFCELDDVSPENWEDAISIVEPILINSHMPALNGTDVKGFLEAPNTNILVFNWGDKGKLSPEVSNLRCSGYYHDCEKYNFATKILRDEAGFNGQAK
ncbi:hypothetical protein FACS189450_14460 [Spirochaetia bacterium]|nr:hypothetical protein FACS1894163_10300 [Spirochaetia bacterium]GHU73975.1 hypothetical protein FACS189450_14460 [Spirochaetia bacterium]